MSDKLYSIRDITFNPFSFEEKAAKIIQLFMQYNNYLNHSPFDTQFLSMQLLKYEARHSNMIEGIDTNDVELLAQDTPTSKKISNYVNSLKKADERIRANPVFSEELILDIHRDLFENMMSVDAVNASPGMWRVKQVQIANHFPPPPYAVPEYMKEFIDWLNDSEPFKGCSAILEALVRGAITHAYFEKIHPFTDGNGRTGRILFNLVLNKYQLTSKPYFYISKAILHDQFLYYQELAKLDKSADYQKWIGFFLDLLIYQLESNIKTFNAATDMVFKVKAAIMKEPHPRYRELKKKIFEYIARFPIFTFSRVYFIIKPEFEDIQDPEFVMIFDEVVKDYHIRKVPHSKHYEFKAVVDIIVGKDW
ncbi:Fic family protein [Spiroplasma culicicola]|uniref:Fic family protein n=1 Tax=Spiroplasma culicicola AES-1 TaxID=1276246 RepID=W6A6G3_9MOLU|nr:Fic family protein [Spiroplasma culicicola]AHI52551.1 Fic family protein [Spiroplasma culicicola AES-1]